MADIALFFKTYGSYFATIFFGGVAGATLTYFLTERRNRVQPVGRRLTVTHVDIQSIIPGYSPMITLMHNTQNEPYHFSGLAIVRLELVNTGNKDIEKFELGIDMPEDSTIIGLQTEGQDRYHNIRCMQEVSMDSIRLCKLDLDLVPFHRKDKYVITLIVNTTDKELSNKIQLSKNQSVKFVDLDLQLEVVGTATLVALELLIPRLARVVNRI